MAEQDTREQARHLLSQMNAACIARMCQPGECLGGCVARIDLIEPFLAENAALRKQVEEAKTVLTRRVLKAAQILAVAAIEAGDQDIEAFALPVMRAIRELVANPATAEPPRRDEEETT